MQFVLPPRNGVKRDELDRCVLCCAAAEERIALARCVLSCRAAGNWSAVKRRAVERSAGEVRCAVV
jgi:hypothetical protein